MKRKNIIFKMSAVIALIMLGTAAFAQVRASKSAPNGITKPPQFIVVGSDDNTDVNGINWLADVLSDSRNVKGYQGYASFYVNTQGWNSTRQNAVKRAYDMGHSIGNHTAGHLRCVGTDADPSNLALRRSEQDIYDNILLAKRAMVGIGIPREHQYGFRTPYLAYSDSTYSAMQKIGFLYDCSINAALPVANANFPYTLDIMEGQPASTVRPIGNVAPDNQNNWWGTGQGTFTPGNPIREHKGLWVIPASLIEIDPDDRDDLLKLYAGLEYPPNYIPSSAWTVAGLDYNLWSEAKANEQQSIRAYINTVKKTLAGNRAPLHFGFHSQYYYTGSGSAYNNLTVQQRRNIFEEFVKQASELEDVFFVTGDMVIAWMQNPCSAEDFNPENYLRKAVIPGLDTEIEIQAQIALTTVWDVDLPLTLTGKATADAGSERTITGVTVDLSDLDGSEDHALTLSGSEYILSYELPETLAIGTKTITFTATDNEGNTQTAKVNLTVNKYIHDEGPEFPLGELIDDFESTNLVTTIGTEWEIASDMEGTNNGSSTIDIEIVSGGAGGTANALKVTYELNKNPLDPEKPPYQWEPYAAFMFGTTPEEGEPYNFACATGISFWHKGDALFVRPLLSTVTDYAYHRAPVSEHKAWTRVVLKWDDFKQPSGWGIKVPLVLSNITDIQWLIEGPATAGYVKSGEVWIDEVQFNKDCTDINNVIAKSDKATVVATPETLSIYSASQISEVSLINVQGITISTQKVQNDFAKISIASLPQGVYLAKISYEGNQTEVVKFVK